MDQDGVSLLPQMPGESDEERDEAFAEHFFHGTDWPRTMSRQGLWKLCYSHGQPPDVELYNLEADPGEFNNLAAHPTYIAEQQRLTANVMEIWGNADELCRRIKNSQRSRLMIRNVLGEGAIF